MLTDIRSRAVIVLSLGLVPIGSSLHAQVATQVATHTTEQLTGETIEMSYRLQALKRNQQGQYEMAGTLRGERRGEAKVEFGFDNGSSGRPGHALVHANWVVRGEPESESFKARLRGTADVVSGQTHLVGTIVDGAGKGQRVETNSRLLNFGPNGSLSDIDGNMVIGGARAQSETPEPTVTPLTTQALTDIPGKEVLMLKVEYPPGGADPVHRHDAHGFIYVLEGSVVMQVKGGKEVTLTPGQTFYEGTGDVHTVGRNASSTKPASFVVFLLKGKGAPALVPAQ
jgi:quercetin dioxygenase-like cupin family protein